MWHRKLSDKIPKEGWEGIGLLLGFLDPLKNNYKRENHIPERNAGKITAIVIIGCRDIPAALEGAEPRMLCEENKGEILLSPTSSPKDALARAPGRANRPLCSRDWIFFTFGYLGQRSSGSVQETFPHRGQPCRILAAEQHKGGQ